MRSSSVCVLVSVVFVVYYTLCHLLRKPRANAQYDVLSHGLPRSSGRHAQIRVSGFSPLIVTFQVSSVRKQSQEADHIRAQPTSWSGHRPCPKFTSHLPTHTYTQLTRSASYCLHCARSLIAICNHSDREWLSSLDQTATGILASRG